MGHMDSGEREVKLSRVNNETKTSGVCTCEQGPEWLRASVWPDLSTNQDGGLSDKK